MNYAERTQRIGGDGAKAWEVHEMAVKREQQGLPVTILSVGDPDFDTPKVITDKAIESLSNGRTHYAPIQGDPELRELIARHHSRTTGEQVVSDQVTVLAGAQCGLFCASLCLFNPGEQVIVPEPMYVTYEAVFGAAGAEVIPVKTGPDQNFLPRPGDIQAAVGPRTRAIFLNSPNNPTGACLRENELLEIAKICVEHDLWLISDEVYGSLVYEGHHISPAGLPGMSGRTVTVNSLSKSHAMTGWRLGWLVGPQQLSDHVGNLALSMLYGCPPFVQDAAKEAFRGELSEEIAMKRGYEERRRAVFETLSPSQSLRCQLPEGGMFFMIDVRPTGLTCQEFSHRLFEAHHISVLAGAAFGESTQGHVRLSLALPPEELKSACRVIARFAEEISTI